MVSIINIQCTEWKILTTESWGFETAKEKTIHSDTKKTRENFLSEQNNGFELDES